LILPYILLIVGFVLLIKGADLAVSGGSGVAEHFRISPVIIGLTVIAFGTSLPEMAVSVTGSLSGQSGIAVGNVLGSNVFNLLVVGGLSALLRPMNVDRNLLKRDMPVSLAAAVLVAIFAAPAFFRGGEVFQIGRVGGLVMLALFAGFMAMLLAAAKKDRAETEALAAETRRLWLNVVLTVCGLAAIVVGSDLVVDSATKIAYSFGLSETFVGLTIVSVGTSLPELVTSLIAAKKGSNDIALGNIIGSNIFNILLVLALAAAISPVTVPSYLFIDAALLIAVTVATMIFCGRDQKLGRWEGLSLFLVYVVYFVYIFMRG
jgi:cation:H+ antiporter